MKYKEQLKTILTNHVLDLEILNYTWENNNDVFYFCLKDGKLYQFKETDNSCELLVMKEDSEVIYDEHYVWFYIHNHIHGYSKHIDKFYWLERILD